MRHAVLLLAAPGVQPRAPGRVCPESVLAGQIAMDAAVPTRPVPGAPRQLPRRVDDKNVLVLCHLLEEDLVGPCELLAPTSASFPPGAFLARVLALGVRAVELSLDAAGSRASA